MDILKVLDLIGDEVKLRAIEMRNSVVVPV